jgi:hypothetical protein
MLSKYNIPLRYKVGGQHSQQQAAGCHWGNLKWTFISKSPITTPYALFVRASGANRGDDSIR